MGKTEALWEVLREICAEDKIVEVGSFLSHSDQIAFYFEGRLQYCTAV